MRSIDRVVTYVDGRRYTYRGQVLAQFRRDGRYPGLSVVLSGTTRMVSAVVLEAFVGPRPPGMEGCHNNSDPSDNRPENLRWDTPKANQADSIAAGTHVSLINKGKTACPRDHLLQLPNLVASKWKKGFRQCRCCHQAAAWSRDRRITDPEVIRVEADRRYAGMMKGSS